MLDFLVKIANILDDKGQHKLAAEIDAVIEKVAQNLPDYQAIKTRWQNSQPQAIQGPEAGPTYRDPTPYRTIPKVAPETAPSAEPSRRGLSKRQAELVKDIQHMLGILNPTGQWDATTDKRFNEWMTEQYPAFTMNGQFKGSLTEAHTLMTDYFNRQAGAAQERAEQPGERARAEEAMKGLPRTPGLGKMPPIGWHSSKGYDLNKSGIQALLKEIEMLGKNAPGGGAGMAQKAIDEVEAGPVLDQAAFEQDLATIAQQWRSKGRAAG